MPFKDKEQAKAYFRAYRKSHVDYYKKYMDAYNKRVREKRKINPGYDEGLKEKQRAYFKTWWEKNKELHRERNRKCAIRRILREQECLNSEDDLSAKS